MVGVFHNHWLVFDGSSARWSVVGYFLGKLPVVGGRCSVVSGQWSKVGDTVVGGWSVVGGFLLRRTAIT